MKRVDSGFTLIEILVVVSILGVLMGLVTLLVLAAPKKEKEFTTKTRITQLKMAIERFNSEMGYMPPMTIEGLAKRSKAYEKIKALDNNTNTCCEALVVALNHPSFSARIGDSLGEAAYGNTDDDSFNLVPKGMSNAEAVEILDGYDYPIVYIEKNYYDKGPFIIKVDDREVAVEAMKRENGHYYNEASFQLISLGMNGIQDGDDITNFTVEGE